MNNPLKEIIINKIRLSLSENKISILYSSIIALGIIINIVYALRSPTFYHPDEVYQTLEIAHNYVYGYGIVSWEWKLGSWVTPANPDGYGPIRSLITPILFSLAFIIGEGLNFNYWQMTLPLIRIILVLNFLTGLYIASKLLKNLSYKNYFHSDKIFLILTLFYHEFIIYGSKTITNTLVVPLVFYSTCFILQIVFH